MARIAGINIPTQKKLKIALTYVYGIGNKISNDICLKLCSNSLGAKNV